jgi:hypothetical protein
MMRLLFGRSHANEGDLFRHFLRLLSRSKGIRHV